MNTTLPPIIFLAFANDRQQGGAYLRNLAEEARRLQESLRPAEQADLCQVVTQQNVTLDQVFDTFQDARYRNRIGVFHYGGHANGYQLLLETATGATAPAHAAGLAAFLAQQRGLALVFLNGCSTQPQVQGLLDAGVSIVIATAQAIDDAVATNFADRFYRALASGATVQSAFHQATSAGQTKSGADLRHLYAVGPHPNEQPADRWPWALYQRPGSAIAAQWNLPQEADNPLFGLPALPVLDPPAQPFRYLQWFRRADAPIFFGRGRQIRDLYTRVTAGGGAPIILFYGQSGVGKSSLLEAGLLPRLETDHQVRYLARDQRTGLLGTLQAALGLTDATAATPVDQLAATWHARSQTKPLTIILDQVEELYTRSQPDPQGELDQCLVALVAIFSNPAHRPPGKLILSFRKEYLPELKQGLGAHQLPYAELFLEGLDQRGIVEAVTGITQHDHLQAHYGLTIAPGLAETIAQDLRSDRGAAVAPTLQILLSKLWERAKAHNYDHPHFDLDLYADLRAKGLLLADFLDQQLVALHQAHPTAVESGLVLDLLAFHTTRLGTAEQRTLTELRTAYAHQQATVLALIQHCHNLYLLADPAENRPDQAPINRLAHDTLAPLVRARFDESDLPGQRARRILESRAIDWADGRGGAPLDEADLALVEAGSLGMRVTTPDEERLVAASIKLRDQRLQEQRDLEAEREASRERELANAQTLAAEQSARAQAEMNRAQAEAKRAHTSRWAAIIASVLLVIALIGIYIAYDRQQAAVASEAIAQAQSTRANKARATSDINAALAITRSLEAQSAQATAQAEAANAQTQSQIAATRAAEAEIAAHLAQSRALAAASQAAGTTDPMRSWLLALEAGRVADTDQAFTAINQQDQALGKPLLTFTHQGAVVGTKWNKDKTRILSWNDDGTVQLWDAASGDLLHTLQLESTVNGAQWNGDESRILSWSKDGTLRLWNATSGEILRILKHEGIVWGAQWNGDENRILSWSTDSTVRVWDAVSGDLLHVLQHERAVYGAQWDRNETRILSWSGEVLNNNGVIRIWDAANGSLIRAIEHDSYVDGAQWNKDETRILSWSKDGTVQLWDTASGDLIHTLQHEDIVYGASWNEDESHILSWSKDGTLRLWNAANGEVLHIFQYEGEGAVDGAQWNKDETRILSWSDDGTVQLWDTASGDLLYSLHHGGSVRGVVWSDDERRILSWSADGTIRLWNTSSGAWLRTLEHEGTVYGAAWNEDDSRILSWSADGTIRLWNTSSGDLLHPLDHEGIVYGAAWSEEETHILSWSGDSIARIWDATSGNLLRIFKHEGIVYGAAWSEEETHILSWSGDGTIRLWNASSGDLLHTFEHGGPVQSAAWSEDENRIFSSSEDGSARIWDAASGNLLRTLQHEAPIYSGAVWSGHESHILSWSKDGTIRLWDTATGEVLRTLKQEVMIWGAASNGDESRILSWSIDGTVRLWDAVNSKVLSTLQHKNAVYGAAWNSDESRILSWSTDSTVRLWDAISGDLLHTFQHERIVNGAKWNGDESRILSWGDDGVTRIWDPQNESTLLSLFGDGSSVFSAQWNQAETQIMLTTAGGKVYRYYTHMTDLLTAACTRATRNLTWSEWQQYLPGEPYRLTCPILPPHPSVPADALVAAGIPPVATPQAPPLPTSTPRP